MNNKYIVYKKLGETPLEALSRLRKSLNIGDEVPMTYAGRLDPLAEGILIILVGDECKQKEKYLGLEKIYTAEILFGIETDSHDLLGIPTAGDWSALPMNEDLLNEKVEKYLNENLGKKIQKYPAYSSKTVGGMQMHEHARAGNEVEVPTHEVELLSYKNLGVEYKNIDEVLQRVENVVGFVTGDFRQEEVHAAWRTLARPPPRRVPQPHFLF